MRPLSYRQALAVALAATVAMVTTGCKPAPEGVVQVVVIGDDPRLVERQQKPLSASDSVLMANAAQGLVRFDAKGQVEPGLAETWNVSDDGLSYIFRLANTEWPSGRKVTAEQVARMLRQRIEGLRREPLKDAFGAVENIVAMTDRVLEIRLRQPRPHLLQLLAQPEMGLVRGGHGTGPFLLDREHSEGGTLRLKREVANADEEPGVEQLDLKGLSAERAIATFKEGKADLVLGGTFVNLPLVQRADVSPRALQFDPASGLFGLIPARTSGPVSDPEVRRLLSQAIDRDALIAELNVPGLVPRATVLEPQLDNMPDPQPPEWAATPLAQRKPALAERARQLLEEEPVIRVALPEGPGAEILFGRLSKDWGDLGIMVERAGKSGPADLKLLDRVAPSTSAAWFLRQFRCEIASICDESADELLEAARNATVLAQRGALLHQASRRIDEQQLFIPLAAPIRWALVSPRTTGFARNRFAVHTLTGLEQQLRQTGE